MRDDELLARLADLLDRVDTPPRPDIHSLLDLVARADAATQLAIHSLSNTGGSR